MSKSTLKDLFKDTKPGDVGIIGFPIEHSFSPKMQNAAFQTWAGAFRDKNQSTPVYHQFPVAPNELELAINLMKKYELRGLNVTVPHKVSVIPLLDDLDKFTKKVGAVNTIANNRGRLKGYNTDGSGFRRSIQYDLVMDMTDKKVLVLGCGGTGRVIVAQLLEMGAQIFWWNRTPETLIEQKLKNEDLKLVNLVSDDMAVKEISKTADLIVNATSVGLSPEDGMPNDAIEFSPTGAAFDVIYHRQTRFMQKAQATGASFTGGIGMLVYQGAGSFEIWTGGPAPKEVMWAAITQSLKEANP